MSADDLEPQRRLEAAEAQALRRTRAACVGRSDAEMRAGVAEVIEAVRRERCPPR